MMRAISEEEGIEYYPINRGGSDAHMWSRSVGLLTGQGVQGSETRANELHSQNKNAHCSTTFASR